MIGLWAPNSERLSTALAKAGVDVVPLVGETMVEAIRSSEVKRYIIAPSDEAEARKAGLAKERDPSRVLVISGLSGQGWQSEESDVPLPLNMEVLSEAAKAHFKLNGHAEPAPIEESFDEPEPEPEAMLNETVHQPAPCLLYTSPSPRDS